MESFNPGYIPNHSDHFGRYNYQNQPSIGFWNLQKLIQATQTIINNDDGLEALEQDTDPDTNVPEDGEFCHEEGNNRIA